MVYIYFFISLRTTSPYRCISAVVMRGRHLDNAALSGDVDGVERLLREGVSVSAP